MVLFEVITQFVTDIILQVGYPGIFILMALGSACTPMPSEVVMVFSGYIAQQGKLNFWLVGIVGTLGGLAGSIVTYYIGYYGGRPIMEKYGKYIMIEKHEIDLADRWFAKYGDRAVFISRLLPIIRAFISLPAGITRMNFTKFIVYSLVGSLPWVFVLTYLGIILGNNWNMLEHYWIYVDIATVLGIFAFIVYVGYKVFMRKGRSASEFDINQD